ncbi:uncharacterized protein STEHIDRAFT_173158 [Stereum hirsutum FP-91666 SS1]|uniref:Uncharacterized protein n=1 Tax=Stereum hirsutum (strain FP-91666) TaxID=721885 RepID=R7RWR3_STEHR|nr:uncharacterized protein STEHIDRAFT_173158 [Stereum hirsutum FP-91666 SS1]EIM79265.1 hypothetical protein STEHIDRAFT_173158 [Stereum hirsutum FP-91666 SS1]
MDGKQAVDRTPAMDERCQVFEILVIHVPSSSFHQHRGVKHACSMIIRIHISSDKNSNTPTNREFSATQSQLQLITSISIEATASFLSSPRPTSHSRTRLRPRRPVLAPSAHINLFDAAQRARANMQELRKRWSEKLAAYMNGGSGDEGDLDGGDRRSGW